MGRSCTVNHSNFTFKIPVRTQTSHAHALTRYQKIKSSPHSIHAFPHCHSLRIFALVSLINLVEESNQNIWRISWTCKSKNVEHFKRYRMFTLGEKLASRKYKYFARNKSKLLGIGPIITIMDMFCKHLMIDNNNCKLISQDSKISQVVTGNVH